MIIVSIHALDFFSPSSSSIVYSRRREFTPELFSLWIPFLFLRAECYGWSCMICVSRIECDTTVHYLLYLMSCYILRFVYSAPPGLTIILAFFSEFMWRWACALHSSQTCINEVVKLSCLPLSKSQTMKNLRVRLARSMRLLALVSYGFIIYSCSVL